MMKRLTRTRGATLLCTALALLCPAAATLGQEPIADTSVNPAARIGTAKSPESTNAQTVSLGSARAPHNVLHGSPIAVSREVRQESAKRQPIAISKPVPRVRTVPKPPTPHRSIPKLASKSVPKARSPQRMGKATQFAMDRTVSEPPRLERSRPTEGAAHQRLPRAEHSLGPEGSWQKQTPGFDAPAGVKWDVEQLKSRIRAVGGPAILGVSAQPAADGKLDVLITISSRARERWVVPTILQIPETRSPSMRLRFQVAR